MAFKGSNRLRPTEAKNMDRLFSLIENSSDPLLSDVADDMRLRKAFGGAFDSSASEKQQYEASNSNNSISNSQAAYDKERERWRTVGTTADTYDKNRAASMNKANDDSLTKKNSKAARDYSGFSKIEYSR